MRLGLLAKYPSEQVVGENRLVAWMVRHCGWLLTRFQVKAIGRTALGREYKGEIVEFAEQVLFYIFLRARDQGPLSESPCRAGDLGVRVGKTTESDEHVLLTPFGSKRSRSIKTVPEESKWKADFLQRGYPGTPWRRRLRR